MGRAGPHTYTSGGAVRWRSPGIGAPVAGSTDERFDKLANLLQTLSESVAGLATSAASQQAQIASTTSTQQDLLQRQTAAAK